MTMSPWIVFIALDSKKSEKDLLLVSKAKLSVYSCFTKILWRGTHQLPKFDVDPNDSFDGIYHIHISVTSDKAKKKQLVLRVTLDPIKFLAKMPSHICFSIFLHPDQDLNNYYLDIMVKTKSFQHHNWKHHVIKNSNILSLFRQPNESPLLIVIWYTFW